MSGEELSVEPSMSQLPSPRQEAAAAAAAGEERQQQAAAATVAAGGGSHSGGGGGGGGHLISPRYDSSSGGVTAGADEAGRGFTVEDSNLLLANMEVRLDWAASAASRFVFVGAEPLQPT